MTATMFKFNLDSPLWNAMDIDELGKSKPGNWGDWVQEIYDAPKYPDEEMCLLFILCPLASEHYLQPRGHLWLELEEQWEQQILMELIVFPPRRPYVSGKPGGHLDSSELSPQTGVHARHRKSGYFSKSTPAVGKCENQQRIAKINSMTWSVSTIPDVCGRAFWTTWGGKQKREMYAWISTSDWIHNCPFETCNLVICNKWEQGI